jgi:lipopolysaccharide/colanic/teichoic acid biosynthesis glycosyltransferase
MPARMRARLGRSLCDLLACAAAFVGVSLLVAYGSGTPTPAGPHWTLAMAISALCCWFSAALFQNRELGLSLWIDQFLCATGLNMLSQYALAYLSGFRPGALATLILGSVAANGLLAALRRWVYGASGSRANVLLLGFDPVAAALAPTFGERLIGVVEDDPAKVPTHLRRLGPVSRLAEIARETQAERIVVACWPAPAQVLLDLQYGGATVVEGVKLYSNATGRVRWNRIPTWRLLFSRSANADPLGMAIQAVYTNVLCLTLLILAVPLLVVLAVFTLAAAGGRPALERSACLGFQMIPFDRLRFRTRRPDGSMHWAGKLITSLRLTSLPELINVMRGEMAFFGPSPARDVFARRLMGLIPAYSQRFTVKPGILGWSQVNLAGDAEPEEAVRLEYDLYYIKQNSFSLDFETFLRAIRITRPGPRPRGDS